ncbi:DHA2 family efflux MFS transporter permease subunit [Lentilactobacillus sp. SPB1-3]|uniref:DHA2 family efflux MFS transporter permease subunit n=1 Tax=Lentilactobacillus terminaliae TaxID=3003483 RepID=A0ACD5DDY7_9LACO|nr:DHA2 family efflux MFS transporter permease subunit [Lentilactobacillus sp. SPB1-3]MCZ0977703.1 DHA2 family efflux MFS transporter permease subunit [Lentilactobacillus sp. SPB1-3]
MQSQNTDKMASRDILSIAAAAIMAFIGVLIETSMNVTFPTLTKQLGVNLSTIQWLTTGYLLMVSLVIVCSSYIKNRFKERNIFIAGTLFAIVGDLFCALAGNFPILLLGRLIQAVGTGIVLPLLFNIILERAPIAKRGVYMGLGGLTVSLAPALGPTFGGIVVYFLSWRDIFWIVLPLMVIGLIMGSAIEQITPLKKEQFDWLRLLLLTIIFVSLTLGFNTISEFGWINGQFAIALVIMIIALAAFIAVSRRSNRVLVNIDIFKNPVFNLALIAYVFIQFTNIGINFVLPNYSQIADNSTSLIAGLIMLPGSLIAGLLNPVWGQMYDSLGAKRPITIGNSLFFLAIVLFAVFSFHISTIMILIYYVIFAIGMTMSFNNTMTYALTIVGPEYETDANAIFNTLQQFAGSIGTAIASSFLASGSGTSAAMIMKSGTQHAFMFVGVLILINFVLYHFVFKMGAKQLKL